MRTNYKRLLFSFINIYRHNINFGGIMPGSDNERLDKDDLYLLLDSYKNSVEMNTIISQQLTNILDVIQQKDSISTDYLNAIIKLADKITDKLDAHNTDSIKNMGIIVNSIGKLSNKINLLYVAFGSIVISLIVLIISIINKYDLIHSIATHLGVG